MHGDGGVHPPTRPVRSDLDMAVRTAILDRETRDETAKCDQRDTAEPSGSGRSQPDVPVRCATSQQQRNNDDSITYAYDNDSPAGGSAGGSRAN